jgi:hypothetical protein
MRQILYVLKCDVIIAYVGCSWMVTSLSPRKGVPWREVIDAGLLKMSSSMNLFLDTGLSAPDPCVRPFFTLYYDTGCPCGMNLSYDARSLWA